MISYVLLLLLSEPLMINVVRDSLLENSTSSSDFLVFETDFERFIQPYIVVLRWFKNKYFPQSIIQTNIQPFSFDANWLIDFF